MFLHCFYCLIETVNAAIFHVDCEIFDLWLCRSEEEGSTLFRTPIPLNFPEKNRKVLLVPIFFAFLGASSEMWRMTDFL